MPTLPSRRGPKALLKITFQWTEEIEIADR